MLPKIRCVAYALKTSKSSTKPLEDSVQQLQWTLPREHGAGAPDSVLDGKGTRWLPRPLRIGYQPVPLWHGGPDYIASLLTGYTGEEKEEAGVTLYENTAFPGGWISMAPPLYGEDVDFNDGHANDLEHISEDVSAFLMWTAEPKMMARKQAGFVSVFFLTILSVLLYLTNKKIWAPIKGKGRKES